MDRSRVLDQGEVEKFVASLADYKPAIPDELVRYYLSRAGFVTDDVRVERLIAVAAQKFIADIANDAIANSRLRAAATPASGSRAKAAAARDPKVTLTVDDLERALREYGVNLRKPPYFADSVSAGLPDTPAQPLHQPAQTAQPQNPQQSPTAADAAHATPAAATPKPTSTPAIKPSAVNSAQGGSTRKIAK
jgi:transcription initiation factor TFIID subunit 10